MYKLVGQLTKILFFLIGGFTRWIIACMTNILFNKRIKSKISYYFFEDDTIKNGINPNKINYTIGIVVVIILIVILEIIVNMS